MWPTATARAQSVGDGDGPLWLSEGLECHPGEADANKDTETAPTAGQECMCQQNRRQRHQGIGVCRLDDPFPDHSMSFAMQHFKKTQEVKIPFKGNSLHPLF